MATSRSSSELIHFEGYLKDTLVFNTRTWTPQQAREQLKIKLRHMGIDPKYHEQIDLREGSVKTKIVDED